MPQLKVVRHKSRRGRNRCYLKETGAERGLPGIAVVKTEQNRGDDAGDEKDADVSPKLDILQDRERASLQPKPVVQNHADSA